MTAPCDEMLMAYADGRLDVLEAAAVEQEMAANPGTLVRLTAFIRASCLVRCAYDPALSRPLSEQLHAALVTPQARGFGPRALWYWPLAGTVLAGLCFVHVSLRPNSCSDRAATASAQQHFALSSPPGAYQSSRNTPDQKSQRP